MRPMRTRSTTLILVLLLALAATGLAACGDGSSSSSGDSVDKILADTFSPGQKVKSGKLDLALDLDLKGVPSLTAPVKLALNGPFQSAGDSGGLPTFDFTAKLALGGQEFSVGAVSTGDKGFVRFQGQTYAVGDALFKSFKTGYEQAQKRSGGKSKGTSLQSLGIDPRRWLSGAQKEGQESVGGTDTIHISSDIDVGKFLDDVNTLLSRAGSIGVAGSTPRKVSKGLTTKQRAQIERAVKSAKLDIYTGKDDRLLRRLAIDVVLDVPADARQQAGGLSSGNVRFALTLADLNNPQTITAPKGAKPLSALTSQLQGLLGGTGSTGSGSSGSSGSGSPGGTSTNPSGADAPAGAPNEYLQCLQKAGEDVAEVQKCAALLSGG